MLSEAAAAAESKHLAPTKSRPKQIGQALRLAVSEN
jgi:hypothetical protein